MDGKMVEVTGTLIFNEHSSHLIENTSIGRRNGCMVFVDFGEFHKLTSLPKVGGQYVGDPVLRNFVATYRSYLKANPTLPRRFRIKGVLSVKKDFRMVNVGRGNGYGYRGLFRTAIAVRRVDDLATVR
jgi:hypothetical protein